MPKTNATMKRWDLINRFIRTHDYSRYLEIGVSTGKHFKRVECRLKKCVDPAQGKYSHANPTCKMTSDEFFETVALPQGKTYNLIFIDGLHESAQMDKDIAGALACLRPAGTVMLHDCNPLDERRQTTPRIQRAWNGDVWKSVVRFRAGSSRYGCIVVDADEGLGIIREDVASDFSLRLPDSLDWAWLDANRSKVLGLVSQRKCLARFFPTKGSRISTIIRLMPLSNNGPRRFADSLRRALPRWIGLSADGGANSRNDGTDEPLLHWNTSQAIDVDRHYPIARANEVLRPGPGREPGLGTIRFFPLGGR